MASRQVDADLLKDVEILKGVVRTDRELGRGSYGRVFVVKYHGQNLAAKEIHSVLIGTVGLEAVTPEQRRKVIDDFKRECQRCSNIHHPNIVQFLGVYYASRTSDLPIMVMELMNTNLTKFVEDNQSNILMITKLSILHDVSFGLKYLHTLKPVVIHRDLSPNNVMLTSQLLAKIGDLGVAKVMQDTGQSRSRLTAAPGTLDFMPPEALVEDDPVYGTAVDVFSFAGIALYVFAEQWPSPVGPKRLDPITRESVPLTEAERRQEYVDKIPESAVILKQLFERCLDDDPDERPPIQEASEMIGLLKTKESAVSDLTYQFKAFNPTKEESLPFAEALQSNHYRIKWTSCRNLPYKLYNASVSACASGDAVFVTAGTAPDYKIYDDVYCYSTTTNRWRTLPQSGHRRGILHMLDNRLTIFGGEDSFTNEVLNKVTTFNSVTDKWYSCYPNMLYNRYMPGVVTYNNYVIVMGGQLCPGDIHNSIEVLDYRDHLQWKEVSVHLPAPMWNFKPTVSANNIAIVGFSTVGGRDKRYYQIALEEIIGKSSQDYPFSRVASQWKELPYPAHWETTIVPYSDPPVIIGGRESRGAVPDICLYNKSINFWKRVGLLTSPRNSVAIALLNINTIIVVGGCTDGSTINTSKATSVSTVEIGTVVPK